MQTQGGKKGRNKTVRATLASKGLSGGTESKRKIQEVVDVKIESKGTVDENYLDTWGKRYLWCVPSTFEKMDLRDKYLV